MTTPVSRGTFLAPTEALLVAAPMALVVAQPTAGVVVAQLAAGVLEAQPTMEVTKAQPTTVQAPLVESVPNNVLDGEEETPMEVSDLPSPKLAEG